MSDWTTIDTVFERFEQGELSLTELRRSYPEWLTKAQRRSRILEKIGQLLETRQTTDGGGGTSPRHQFPRLMPGLRIGVFTLLEKLGEGGCGEVWKAREEPLCRPVAIKTQRQGNPCDLTREAQRVAELVHPNIVRVNTFVERGDEQYMVSEFIEGVDLKPFSRGKLRLPLADVVRIVSEVLDGLAYAHSKGIVHRDIKPGNILIQSESGKAYITDFGTATTRSELMDNDYSHVGTLAYMAPEQIQRNTYSIGPATDIHAVGMLLYGLMVGRHPFEDDTAEMLTAKLLTAKVPSPREFDRKIPEGVAKVCLRALEKNPADRYQTAEAMSTSLAAATGKRLPPAIWRALSTSAAMVAGISLS